MEYLILFRGVFSQELSLAKARGIIHIKRVRIRAFTEKNLGLID